MKTPIQSDGYITRRSGKIANPSLMPSRRMPESPRFENQCDPYCVCASPDGCPCCYVMDSSSTAHPVSDIASTFTTNRCNWNPDPGKCLAYIPKYYYDQDEGRCKQFIWGGCGGVVPFDTLEECVEDCPCMS